MKVVVALCLLAAAAVQVYAMPYGAPAQACANITPGGPHLGNLTEMPPYVNNTANMSDNPFMLDLSQFQCPGNQAGFCYIPGIHYLSKFDIIIIMNAGRLAVAILTHSSYVSSHCRV